MRISCECTKCGEMVTLNLKRNSFNFYGGECPHCRVSMEAVTIK